MINVVTGDEGRIENEGTCVEVRTVPVDRAFVRRTETVAGEGNPGDRIVVIGNLAVTRAGEVWLNEWRGAEYRARRGAIRMSEVDVAAPWLGSVAVRFGIHRREFSGDARDLLPDDS